MKINTRVYAIILFGKKILVCNEIINNYHATKFPGGGVEKGENPEEGIEYLNSAPSYDSLNLAEGVSNIEMLNKKYGESNSKYKIAVIDCGVKENILKLLSKRDCSVKIFSSDFELDDLNKFNPDGILISPGPGDHKNKD